MKPLNTLYAVAAVAVIVGMSAVTYGIWRNAQREHCTILLSLPAAGDPSVLNGCVDVDVVSAYTLEKMKAYNFN